MILAAVAHADPVDDLVNSEMKRQDIPGLSLAVVHNGKIVKEKGYGFANIEHQVAVTPDTVFMSASVGKQFTAALVMLLARDGKLSLDAPISTYLPNTPKSWEAITVRQLLTHTSGLGDLFERVELRKDYADEELLELESAMSLRFKPGEKWLYSNTGYHLLGLICNRVGKKKFADQLEERIFKPLGMSTRVVSEQDIVMHRASGYEHFIGKFRNHEWASPGLNTIADGNLYLTAHDLALWDLALYGEFPLDSTIKQAIWTPVTLNDKSTYPYGFGWDLEPWNGHRVMWHSGRWQGFRTHISRFVDDKLTVIVLTNVSGAQPAEIARGVAGLYVPALKP